MRPLIQNARPALLDPIRARSSAAAAHARPHGGLRPWLVVVLTVLTLLALAQPAAADAPQIHGVSQGERLTGSAILWAEARGPSHWITLRLTGPGTDLEARGTNRRVHLLETAASGAPLPWDADQATPGTYTLTATSFFRGRDWDRRTLTFTVAKPAPTNASAENRETLAPRSVSVAPEPPAPARRDDLPVARFGDGPTTFSAGRGPAMPFTLTGPLPEDGDVLVLAWDHTRRQMVDPFPQKITRPPFLLNANHLARLVPGRYELQLHVRADGAFVQTDTRDITVTRATAAPQAGREALPEVSFPLQSRTFTRGDGRSLQLDVEGTVPQDGDLLVIAWSLGRGELVERFAHKLDAAPWQVPARRLAQLPAGENEVQVLVRRNGTVERKVAMTIQINEPATNPSRPEPAPQPNNPQPEPTTPVAPLPNPSTPPVTNPNPANPGDGTPVVTVPDPAANLNLAFAAGVPNAYTRSSNATLRVALGGPLPDDADILLLAWSHDQRQMVGAFAHTLRQGDRTLKNGQLDKLPAGRVELQAHLRLATGTVQVAKHDVTVSVPAETKPDETYQPLPDIAAGPGFTAFPLPSGGRIIYVSSSQGNDSNTGLSPNSPLKSPQRGVEMLRSGFPDQLLFKAGDTFRGGLGDWSRSGRDRNAKMVVGVYGDGPRPRFFSDGQHLVSCHQSVNHVAFVGLHGYANRRDPSSRDYRGDHGSTKEVGVFWFGNSDDLHFEDMKLEWYTTGLVFQNSAGKIRNVRLHRMIVANHWKDKADGHAQGMYMQGVHDAEITDSIFDHNGWRPGRDNERTKFNHNMYNQKDTKRITIRRTILTRGSHNAVQLRGGGILEDSLLAYNPYGAFVAQEGGIIRRNVVLHGNDMLSSYPLGLALETLPSQFALIEDNIIAHKVGTAGWVGAIQVSYRDDIIDPPGSYNVTIQRNRVVNYPRESRRESIYKTTDRANVKMSGNLMDYASGGDKDPPFIDPKRDLNGYARSIGAGNMDGFLSKAKSRERGQWEDRYAAVGANAWIRAGYEFLPYD